MDLRAAIAEKHDDARLDREVVDRRGELAIELMRQQIKVGTVKRAAIAHAGSSEPMREFCRLQLLEEIRKLDRLATEAREWEVV